MNRWLFTFLLLLNYNGCAQGWPQHPQTDKIEFTGTLPWPVAASTTPQRRKLVRNWYATKLTDLTSEAVAKQIWVYREPLTYDSLPKSVLLKYQNGERYSQLSYTVELLPTAQGISYHLSNFSFGWADEDVAQEVPLESVQQYPNIDPMALTALRRRIDTALAGW